MNSGAARAERAPSSTKLSGSSERYRVLVQLLTRDTRYAKILAEVSKPSEHDKLADALVNLTYSFGGTVLLVRSILSLEFKKKIQHPNTILRVNSIASKVMGVYVRHVGQQFLIQCLKDIVEKIVAESDDIGFEVDGVRMRNVEEELKAEKIAENVSRLEYWVNTLLQRITAAETLALLPREIRAMASHIQDLCDMYGLDTFPDCSSLSLIGGFVMLRYIQPALTLPESYGILSKPPSSGARRSLILAAKIIQKVSNSEYFDTSEVFMMPFNKVIGENIDVLHTFLREVCIDPLVVQSPSEGSVASAEADSGPKSPIPISASVRRRYTLRFERRQTLSPGESTPYERHSPSGASDRRRLQSPWEDLETTVSFEEMNVREVQYKHLLFIHRLLDKYTTEIIPLLSKYREDSGARVLDDSLFVQLLHDLGPAPANSAVSADTGQRSSSVGQKKTKDAESVSKKRTDSSATPAMDEEEKRQLQIMELNYRNILSQAQTVDCSVFEKANFFFRGSTDTVDGCPVFYLVAWRMTVEMLTDYDLLMLFLVRTMGNTVDSDFVLVVDISHAEHVIDDFIVLQLHKHLSRFYTVFSKKHYLNMRCVYFLHPSISISKPVTELCEAYLPDRTKEQGTLVFLANWRELIDTYGFADVEIPLLSKQHVPHGFAVKESLFVQDSSYSEKQERILKLTPISILSIDGKNDIVREEINLENVEEVVALPDGGADELGVSVKFRALHAHRLRNGLMCPQLKWSCTSAADREALISAMFHSSIVGCSGRHDGDTDRYDQFSSQPARIYEVIKINQRGRRQKRTLKLTVDSLINTISGETIKKEIPYSVITRVVLSKDDPNLIELTYMWEGAIQQYRLLSDSAVALYSVLRLAMQRYTERIVAEVESCTSKTRDEVVDQVLDEVQHSPLRSSQGTSAGMFGNRLYGGAQGGTQDSPQEPQERRSSQLRERRQSLLKGTVQYPFLAHP